MILTHDYKKIQSVFQSPVDYQSGDSTRDFYKEFDFTVGPIEYTASFERGPRSDWMFQFYVKEIHLKGEELVDYLSKIFRKKLTYEAALDLKGRIEWNDAGHSLLGSGGELHVFSAIVKIVRDFVTRTKLKCLNFLTNDQKRANLYTKILKRFDPSATIKRSTGEDRGYDLYECCFSKI